jgi:sodium/hydrogen antiporter
MEIFSSELFVVTLALVGAVIVIAALLSGLIERSGLPQVGVFLALGAILGPAALGLLNVSLESPILRVVATLSLVLVLFTDAVGLDIAEVKNHRGLAALVLGPGTMLSAVFMSLAGWWLLGLPLAAAVTLGASLASTDPVMLRGMLKRRDLSAAVRQALRLESGMNDAVLLPVVIIAMACLSKADASIKTNWGGLTLDLFVLGPVSGIAIGFLSVAVLDLVRRKISVRRDYESLYSLGVAFTAYAAAEAMHASGFLAAFTAGLMIAILDVELCDCFLEYGETTAEMTLLFTFVLFGSSLIWTGLTVLNVKTAIFAILVLFLRPVAFLPALAGTKLDWRSRFMIAWFGPRGLSSLLLVLVAVFAGVSGSKELFSICCLVVLLSVIVHGASLMFLRRDATMDAAMPAALVTPTPPPVRSVVAEPGADHHSDAASDSTEIISIDEMQRLQQSGAPVFVLDVRKERAYDGSDGKAVGAIRILPDDAVKQVAALGLPKNAWLIAFCA